MYDRTVRRRRLVLGGLVALSLLLLTVYFGESTRGALHTVQRGALSALAPVQEGANRALKPFRDLFGWMGDTIDAKKERDQLVRRNRQLEALVTRQQVELSRYDQLKKMVDVNASAGLERYRPVQARVIGQSPSLFYSEIKIDKGSSEGIERGQPVTGGGGLVGRVSSVVGNAALIKLITDEEFAVAARTLSNEVPGTIKPAVGAPGDLVFDFVSQSRDVDRGERIVTAGTSNERLPSLFPAGIPVGTVRRIEDGAGRLDRTVHVRPAAELTRLQFVSVLTQPGDRTLQAAALP